MIGQPRWLKVGRDIWGNLGRTTLVVISIAVGVFAFGGLMTAREVVTRDLNESYLAVNPASGSLSISEFDEDLVQAVEGLRDVESAEGRSEAFLRVRLDNGDVINVAATIVPKNADLEINAISAASGEWPPGRLEISFERSSAERWGFQAGDVVTISLPDGSEHELTTAGEGHDVNSVPASFFPIASAYISEDTAEWLGLQTEFNTLYVTVSEYRADEAHIERVIADIKDRVEGFGYSVSSTEVPTPLEHPASASVDALTLILGALGVFSLFLSGFLVVNTISATLAQQVKQIGVMKAIGAQSYQLMQMYLVTVLVYGLLALVLSLPLAWILGRGFTVFLAGLLNFDIQTFAIPRYVLAMQAVIALLVPVIAALIPIIQGTKVTIREAIDDDGGAKESVDGSMVDRLMSQLRGLPRPIMLSLRNTFRRKGRLALTLSTLALAGGIFIAVFGVRAALQNQVTELLSLYDLDVQVNLSDSYRIERLEREAMNVPGVSRTEVWGSASAVRLYNDGSEGPTISITGPPADTEFLLPTVEEGRWIQANDQRVIVVNRDLLQEEPDLQLGSTVTLEIDSQEYTWEIVGITAQTGSIEAYVSYEQLSNVLGTFGYGSTLVVRTEQRDPVSQQLVSEALDERFRDRSIVVSLTRTISDIEETAVGTIDVMIGMMLVMAFLVAVVGGLGLAGTMSLNVLERTREIGVMRGIGASNQSIRQIVVVEGMLIGLLSALFGIFVSIPLGVGLSNALGMAFAGEPYDYVFSLLGVLLWLVLAMMTAAASSLIPAVRASSISVRAALAYE